MFPLAKFLMDATAEHMTVTTALALPNGNDPICVVHPKVAKASRAVTVV
jgi:hypothetical protein